MSDKRHRILIEASGSLTSGYLISNIQAAGHACVCSDIDDRCFGRVLADDFFVMPRSSDPKLWQRVEDILVDNSIDIVIPSLDETLQGWSERKNLYAAKDIHVVTSDPQSIAICQDKWRTFQFFTEHGIPTPQTSLSQEYPLIKPRQGRGGVGVQVAEQPVDMKELVSQELLTGTEYTIDVFCDRSSKPVYIVPRCRLNVKDGKSTAGVVERHEDIERWVHAICERLPLLGPVNMQCFVLPDGSIQFVEINPRIAGGMALGFAATENWISLIMSNIRGGEPVSPKPINDGLEMRRYYSEVFIPSR